MIEVRWHGRGGQGAKSMSQVLAEAWLLEGQFVQAFPEYGPERSGAPVTAYTRSHEQPIRIHHAIRNPDLVVVLDPSLLGEVPLAAGLKEDGLVLINSTDPAQRLAPRLPQGVRWSSIAAEPLARAAGSRFANVVMLGAAAQALGSPSLSALQEAFGRNFAKLSPEALSANLQALQAGYQSQLLWGEGQDLKDAKGLDTAFAHLPGGVVLAQNALHPNTGSWRTGKKPLVKAELCNDCLLCWVYCPDVAIATDGQRMLGFDYDHCKACELCVKACPSNAIQMVAEETLNPGGAYA